MNFKHLVFAAVLTAVIPSSAQEIQPGDSAELDMSQFQMPPMPKDTAVIVGHLDNGLTYYIRHNDYPKDKVNFYIAQRVGAVQEEDDQDGLAHFLEHMAFNGSKHFPDDSVTKFMNGLGAQWNAYTTADHTVYYVSGVGNERESALDSCLLLLSDWSEGLTLDEKQLDDQRDVVHNEYRSHGAMQRLMYESLPKLFPDSRYGTRTVIGNMDVIDHCNSDRLRDYYHKWYYPANQAVVIVGDIDPHKWEAKVRKLFAPLPVPPTAHEAEDLQVADNDTTLYFLGSDKEMSQTVFVTFRKDEVIPKEMKATMPYMMIRDLRAIGSQMFNDRMLKLSQQPDANFVAISSYDGNYGFTSRTRNAQSVQIMPKPGKEAEALKQGLLEMKRVAQYGFTQSELNHTKETVKASLDDQYNNRATIKNGTYAQTLINNFLDGEPYPSIEQEYPLQNQILPMVTLDMVNEAYKSQFSIEPENFAVAAYTQQKDGKPVISLDEVKKIVEEARAAEVTAPVDTAKDEPLMPVLPKPGKITKTTENKTLGYKELTLSNGAKVILKKTDFKANEIVFEAVAPGGLAVTKNLDMPTRKFFEGFYSMHGLGTKSVMDLVQITQTKNTVVDDGISNDQHWIGGSTTNENVETLMQLINLSFTAVKKDEAVIAQTLPFVKGIVENKFNNPDIVMSDSADYYNHSQRAEYLSPDLDDFDKVDFDKILDIRRELFSNAADFTFIFVGSLDEDSIRPLIEQYIASLPSKKSETAVEDNRYYTSGNVSREFTKAMGNPQSVTRDTYRSAKVPYTLKNIVNVKVLGQVLWNKEFDIIRERESAAYTPQPDASIDYDLTGTYMLIRSNLQTNPAKTARATELADSIVTNVATWVTADDVQKGREYLAKDYSESVRTNRYWRSTIEGYVLYGIDRYTDFEKELNAVTPKTVGETANIILSAGNHVRVVMNAIKEENDK